MQKAVRGTVSWVSDNCKERRVEIEDGEHLALVEGVRHTAHVRKRLTIEVEEGVEAFVVGRDTHGVVLVGDGDQRRGPGRSRMLDETCREILVQHNIHHFGSRGLMQYGRDATGFVPGRTVRVNGVILQASKSVLEVEKTSE